jgi:hypothetical protein
VEAGIFGIPSGLQQQERQILGRLLSYYLVDVEIDDEDLEGVEEFLVVREGSLTPRIAKVINRNSIKPRPVSNTLVSSPLFANHNH